MAQTDRSTGLVGETGIKEPVKAATTANITLSGEQTIDGVSCVDGDRVLVKDQTSGVNNGIYEVDTGTWSRTKDCDGAYDLVQGSLFLVYNGTTNGNRIFKCTTADPITIGTTSLAFSELSVELIGTLAVADGGTGSITAAGARTNLNAASLGANTFTGLQNWAAGANIASAATVDLTAATGNSPRITGTTATSAVTMNAGQICLVVADAAWPLTHNSTTNKLNAGTANYTLTAGDMVLYSKDLSGIVHGFIIRADGRAVMDPAMFTSSAQTITSAGALTLAHGLSFTPKDFDILLTCATAEYNYSIGDVVNIGSLQKPENNRGASIVPDATNLNIRYGSDVTAFSVLNKTTGAGIGATNANWTATFRARL